MSCDLNELRQILRPYLKQALTSYQTFLADESWSDAKEFSAFHSACKSVLGHIALLLKLTAEDNQNTQTQMITDWVQRAKSAADLQEDLNVDFD